MSPALSIAASRCPDVRQDIGIQMLARTEPISPTAVEQQRSRSLLMSLSQKETR